MIWMLVRISRLSVFLYRTVNSRIIRQNNMQYQWRTQDLAKGATTGGLGVKPPAAGDQGGVGAEFPAANEFLRV